MQVEHNEQTICSRYRYRRISSHIIRCAIVWILEQEQSQTGYCRAVGVDTRIRILPTGWHPLHTRQSAATPPDGFRLVSYRLRLLPQRGERHRRPSIRLCRHTVAVRFDRTSRDHSGICRKQRTVGTSVGRFARRPTDDFSCPIRCNNNALYISLWTKWPAAETISRTDSIIGHSKNITNRR